MSRPLRFWLSLGLSIQVVLSVLAVALVLLWALVPQIKKEASDQHQLLSQAAASQVGHFLGSFDSHLTLLVGDMAAKSPSQIKQLQEMLDTAAQVQLGIEALYIVDPASRVVAVGLPKANRNLRDNLMGINFSGRMFATEARQRAEKVWSNTYLSARGNIVVALAVPFAFSTSSFSSGSWPWLRAVLRLAAARPIGRIFSSPVRSALSPVSLAAPPR